MSRIDPAEEARHYREQMLASKGANLDEPQRALLEEELRRASIEPYAWVINASLAAAKPRDPVLASRARAELNEIRRVTAGLEKRTVLVPFQLEEPTGVARLLAIAS